MSNSLALLYLLGILQLLLIGKDKFTATASDRVLLHRDGDNAYLCYKI